MTVKELQQVLRPMLNNDETSNMPVVVRAIPRKFKGLPLTEDRLEYVRDRVTHLRYLKINATEDYLRPNRGDTTNYTTQRKDSGLSVMDLYIVLEEIISDIGNVEVRFEYNISKIYGGLQIPQEVGDINPRDVNIVVRNYGKVRCLEIEAPMPEINKIR